MAADYRTKVYDLKAEKHTNMKDVFNIIELEGLLSQPYALWDEDREGLLDKVGLQEYNITITVVRNKKTRKR
jgi:spermidine/putrescine-binding protein